MLVKAFLRLAANPLDIGAADFAAIIKLVSAETITTFAQRALPKLNAILLPAATAEIESLHRVDVSGSVIASLYPFDVEAYRQGITALRADSLRRTQVHKALAAARLTTFWDRLRRLPDAADLLPIAALPAGEKTPLGDKRSLRLLVLMLHALQSYEFERSRASLMQVHVWNLLNNESAIKALEILIERLGLIASGLNDGQNVRPQPTPRQVRRHNRNYPRHAGRRFRRARRR